MNRILVITGRKGSGKSYWTRENVIARSVRDGRAVLVLDALSEYGDMPGATVYTATEFLDMLHAGGQDQFAVVQDSQDYLEEVLEQSYSMLPHTLVIEEAHRYMNPHYLSPNFELLVREGRHRSINIVCVTQRASDLPERFLSQADAFVLFRQRGANDLKRLEFVTGEDVTGQISELPDFTPLIVRIA